MVTSVKKITNQKSNTIKVLLVDDSLLALAILKRMLLLSPDIQVVGTATNGKQALELIPILRPTVICTDLLMPVMDGLELTREVMARYPTPILVVSIAVEGNNIFTVLEAGAIDVFPKPPMGLASEFDRVAPELIQKIKIVSGVHAFRKTRKKPQATANPEPAQSALDKRILSRIVIMGASTGGPQTLQTILSELPEDYPLPIVCIQHISEGFLQGFVDWLASSCKIKIKIVGAGEPPLPGTIYFPREGTHLTFDPNGKFVSSTQPPLAGHRPSVTMTMQSAAQCYGSAAVGVLLTGMGTDGAEGMLAISREGGITIAQDEASSVVFGMPRKAIELGAARYVVPMDEVADILRRLRNK